MEGGVVGRAVVGRAVVGQAVARTLTAAIANRGTVTPAEQRAEDVVLGAREAVADLVGGDPRGVAFGRSMTQLTFDLARTLAAGWGPGDEVVVTRLDHDANVAPWLIAAARAGAEVRFAEPDRETLELPAAAVQAVLSPRTRWVAVTAASNAVGTIPDLPGIVAAAHAAGAEPRDRLVAVLGVHDREALALEDSLDQPTLCRIIVDDENRFGHMKTPTGLDARLIGRGLVVVLL